jgi:hypothetical protein
MEGDLPTHTLAKSYLKGCKDIGVYLNGEAPKELLDALKNTFQLFVKNLKPESLVHVANMAILSHNQAACTVGENEELLNILSDRAVEHPMVISAIGLFSNENIRAKLATKALPLLLPSLIDIPSDSRMFELLGACKNILYNRTGDVFQYSLSDDLGETTSRRIMSAAKYIIEFTGDVFREDTVIRVFAMVFYLLNRRSTFPCYENLDPTDVIIAGLKHTHNVELLSAITDLLRFVPCGSDDGATGAETIDKVLHVLAKVLDDLRVNLDALIEHIGVVSNKHTADVLNFCGNIAHLPKDYFKGNAKLLGFVNEHLAVFSPIDPKIRKAVDNLKYDIIYGTTLSKAATTESVQMRSRVYDPKRVGVYLDAAYGRLIESLNK